MVIEVRKVQFGAAATHQETLNFACEVWADGKLIGNAHNAGHGGCTDIHAPYPKKGKDIPDWTPLREAEKWASSQPPIPYDYGDGLKGESKQTLEDMVDDLVGKIFDQKEVDRVLKSVMRKTKNCIIIADISKIKTEGALPYREIKFSWDINEGVNVNKNEQAISIVKNTLTRVIPTLKDGEHVINENIKHLIEEVTAELATKSS